MAEGEGTEGAKEDSGKVSENFFKKTFLQKENRKPCTKDEIKEVLSQEKQQWQIGHKTKALGKSKKSLHQLQVKKTTCTEED